MIVKFFSIALSFLVLFQSLGLHSSDVTGFDALIKHLNTHEQDLGDNIFTFLDKHYGFQKNKHDNEEDHGSDDHEKLPFKHEICKVPGSVHVILPKIFRLEYLRPSSEKETPLFVKSQYSFLKQFEIFQPPRRV